jgi:hypothetical protein
VAGDRLAAPRGKESHGRLGQSLIGRGATVLRNWDPVPLIQHKVDPGFYAVFARGVAREFRRHWEWEHAGYLRLTVGSQEDETYGRLRVEQSAGGDPELVKASTPVTLIVVSDPNEKADSVSLIARGGGATVIENRITIIALDETRDPVYFGEEPDAPTFHDRL